MSIVRSLKGSSFTASLMHHIGTPMVTGIVWHGTTEKNIDGVENTFGRYTDVATFETHLTFIVNNYRVLSLTDFVLRLRERKPLPRKSVFLTFDDCYAGNFFVAYPLLQKYGVTATFFAPTWNIETGRPLIFDIIDAAVRHSKLSRFEIALPNETVSLSLASEKEKYQSAIELHTMMKAVPYEKQDEFLEQIAVSLGFKSSAEIPFLGEHARPMTWDHIKEMQRGGMEFGSHTHHHAILARMKPDDAEQELIVSKALLENHLQVPCTTFCYPIGAYPGAGNESTNELVKKTGYHCATYMGGGVNTRDTDPYFIARECLGQTTSVEDLKIILAIAGHRVRHLLGKDRSPHARSIKEMQSR